MGPKNLLILFFSTVAVSLVILIIFFSLIFKNFSLDFNTRLPESAPDIGSRFNAQSSMSPDSKAEGIQRSTVNVPPEVREVPSDSPGAKSGEKAAQESWENEEPVAPPVTDDILLEAPYGDQGVGSGDYNSAPAKPKASGTTPSRSSGVASPGRNNNAPVAPTAPEPLAAPAEDAPASGPPVP